MVLCHEKDHPVQKNWLGKLKDLRRVWSCLFYHYFYKGKSSLIYSLSLCYQCTIIEDGRKTKLKILCLMEYLEWMNSWRSFLKEKNLLLEIFLKSPLFSKAPRVWNKSMIGRKQLELTENGIYLPSSHKESKAHGKHAWCGRNVFIA